MTNQSLQDLYRLHTGRVVEEYYKRVVVWTFLERKIEQGLTLTLLITLVK